MRSHEPVLPQCGFPLCVGEGGIETDTAKACFAFVRRHRHHEIDLELLRGSHQPCMLIEDLAIFGHRG